MFKEGKHWVPVEISNLAVTELEKRIATLEARNSALEAEVYKLRYEWKVSVGDGKNVYVKTAEEALLIGQKVAALAAENERLRKEADGIIHFLSKCESPCLKEDAVATWNAIKEGGTK